jgi:hypothetical protein
MGYVLGSDSHTLVSDVRSMNKITNKKGNKHGN